MLWCIVFNVSVKCTVLLCGCITPEENNFMKKIRWSAVAAMLMAGTADAQPTELIIIDRNYNGGENVAQYTASNSSNPFNDIANWGSTKFTSGTGAGVVGDGTEIRRPALFFMIPSGYTSAQVASASLSFRLFRKNEPTNDLAIYSAPLDTLGTNDSAYARSMFSDDSFADTGLRLSTTAPVGNHTFDVTSLVKAALDKNNATTVIAFRLQMVDDVSLDYGNPNNFGLIGFEALQDSNCASLTLEMISEPPGSER
jgi:hypothetical protein